MREFLRRNKNRQNSIETNDVDLQSAWNLQQQNVIDQAKKAYNWAIDNGIAKEQARAVLPEGNTESVLYMAGSLRSWIHYCELRRGHGTQKEHIKIADDCWEIIKVHFPSIAEALED